MDQQLEVQVWGFFFIFSFIDKCFIKIVEFDWNNELIAQNASVVELSKLSKPIGRQDHYLSSLGGSHS